MTAAHIVPQAPADLPLLTFGVGMILGLPEITEKNWQKAYVRLQLAKQLGLMQENPEDRFTPEFVRRHLGQTLVGNYTLSDAAWRTNVMQLAAKKHTDFLDAWTTAQ